MSSPAALHIVGLGLPSPRPLLRQALRREAGKAVRGTRLAGLRRRRDCFQEGRSKCPSGPAHDHIRSAQVELKVDRVSRTCAAWQSVFHDASTLLESARLSNCWHPLWHSIPKTPLKKRGCSNMTVSPTATPAPWQKERTGRFLGNWKFRHRPRHPEGRRVLRRNGTGRRHTREVHSGSTNGELTRISSAASQ